MLELTANIPPPPPGISLLTQLLYILVFLTRYLDLFWVSPDTSYWNFVLKNFYIWSSLYILLLMLRVYPRTREREKAWRLAIYATGGSVIAAPVFTLVFKRSGVVEMLYTFSLALESGCILPQLLLLRQTTVPTVITSLYLLTLGSYRLLYIFNWIVRAAGPTSYFDPIAAIFGIIQTALYVDFAWVYWTRQRVKLRGGGLVDSDDLRKSWLVGGLLGRAEGGSAEGGRGSIDDEGYADIEDQRHGDGARMPNGNARKSTTAANRWGKRGVSVSADDTLEEHEQTRSQRQNNKAATAERGTTQESGSLLKQPDEFLHDDGNDQVDTDHAFSLGDGDPATPTTSISTSTTTTTPARGQHHQTILNSEDAWDRR
jgi:ER lumen protein retaining receptor